MGVSMVETIRAFANATPRALRIPIAGSVVAAALALAALSGWQLDVPALRRLGWRGTQMFPLTALMLLALAGALAAARISILRPRARPWNPVTWLCAALALAPALWTLADRTLGLGASLELSFFRERVLTSTGGANPGGPALSTALAVICMGLSIGVAVFSGRCATRVRVVSGAIGVAVPFVALLAYADGAALPHTPPAALDGGVSLPAALALIALGAGMIGLRPTSATLGLLAGDGAGGIVARRMLPFALGTPLLLSWAVHVSRDLGLLEAGASQALHLGISSILLVALTLWTASVLNRADSVAKRSAVEAELLLSRVKGEALTDGLTQLANRRALDRRVQHELARSLRYKQEFSFLLIDIDHFKEYNDEFGHLEGDEVLRAVGRMLRGTARSTDFVARYGGEEFAVVLACTEIGGARITAERVRSSIECIEWTHRPITASIGGTTSTGPDESVGSLIAAADRALYRAKRAGRNRSVHAQDDSE